MKEYLQNRPPVVIAAPAQAFFHLGLSFAAEIYKLSFSVKDETNIRYYLIEGSHDMMVFERISRIYAKGDSDLPRTYSAAIHNTTYSYYRIRQVDRATAAANASSESEGSTTEQNNVAGEGFEQTYRAPSAASIMYLYER